MNPQRSAQVLGLSQTAVVAGLIVAWLSGFGSAGLRNTGAALMVRSRVRPSARRCRRATFAR